MDKLPKISVIIPIYNASRYLSECLDSILNQTYKNLEIICVNDGSKDNSLEILKDYEKKYSNIKVISKENGGVIGINYCPSFVKKDLEENDIVTVKDIVKHIVYIRDLIGIDYVGFGSDFDGISNKNLELKDASMMNLVIDELKKENFSDEDIEKISFKNVLRVFRANF